MSKLVYDPNNPMPDDELDKLAKEDFDKFLEYLDSKTAYLKSKTRPLNKHELKKFAALAAASEGRKLTDKEYEDIEKQGKINEEIARKQWRERNT
jgi:hypothetical protein